MFKLSFASTVLHLRGDKLIKQPLVDNNKNVLLWNGEIYQAFHDKILKNENDSQALLKHLSYCRDKDSIFDVLSSIKGPYSFIYWSNTFKKLWFGRDFLGRRSLCWSLKFNENLFKISSIANIEDELSQKSIKWEEVPTDAIYCIDLKKFLFLKENIESYKWSCDPTGYEINAGSILKSPVYCQLNQSLPYPDKSLNIPDSVVNEFIKVLEDSVKIRTETFNHICSDCYYNQKLSQKLNCTHAFVSVCFSGGLDSTLLALILEKFIPIQNPIDLLNVAFEEDAPDRLTGLESWEELKKLKPLRKWNFIQIDVNREDLRKSRDTHIKHLIYPLNTVLDDSIGCALWFASKGVGILKNNESNMRVYKSPSRVIFLGMGIDEQLSGYTRHRSVFKKKSWAGLIEEVSFELKRIAYRNLGRDDRIVSDHQREARYPYLDENLINFLNSLPIWMKVNLNLERGKGEKLLLRLAAKKLKLLNASKIVKRAIQFGSRIAKLESKKEKGSDLCLRL